MKVPTLSRSIHQRATSHLAKAKRSIVVAVRGVTPQKSLCRQMCDYIPVPELQEICKSHCPY